MSVKSRRVALVFGLGASLLLGACGGQSVGAPCAFEGDGFQSRHNCATQWEQDSAAGPATFLALQRRSSSTRSIERPLILLTRTSSQV